MDNKTMQHELKEYAINGGPIATVTGLYLFGYPVADVACVLAIVWTVIQISFSVYDRWCRHMKNKKDRELGR